VSQRAAAPEPEEIAGRYQVIKRLGAGAFGTVYKVKDKVLGRMLAIKTIRLEGLAASGASLDELMDRFKREAQISAQLRHPNIVTIYDVGDSDGMSYLAMEFIDGVGLDRVIAAAGRLPLERAALIGAQVADALDFAHQHNIVHRDIKPANIMIETGDRVKVTDFGIAKVTDSGEHLTMTGSLLGTPSYMSPEQAKGARLDGRSDLFAAGAILYEMLAGQKAFRGDSITGLIFKIITEEPQLITELDPTLPAEMAHIVQRSLSKAPEARFQSGREMAEALLAFTRAGGSPTLRQAEIDTMRGAGVAAPPTMSGASATMAESATQARPGGTQVAAPGTAGAPRPADPTQLVSRGIPAPPAVDPTYLVGSGSRPGMAAQPAPFAPPPPPPYAAAPQPAPRMPAPSPAPPSMPAPAAYAPPPPSRGARPAPAPQSKTGLVVGIAAVGLLAIAGLGGGAAWYFTRDKVDTGTSATAGATGTTADPTTTASPAADATSGSTTAGGTSASPGIAEASPSGATTGGGTTADAGTTAGASSASATGSGGATASQTTGGGGQPAGGSTAGSASSGRPSGGTGTTGGGATSADAGLSSGGAAGAGDLSMLDREPPELSGRETGASVADTYRDRRGSTGGSFGATGRLRARGKVPPDLTLGEKRAAVVLVNLMGLQAVYQKRNGRYGNFQEVMPVPVGSGSRFDRANYRFELRLQDEGYTITATSMAGRALQADDSGFVTYVE
jgi:hypothetical protein